MLVCVLKYGTVMNEILCASEETLYCQRKCSMDSSLLVRTLLLVSSPLWFVCSIGAVSEHCLHKYCIRDLKGSGKAVYQFLVVLIWFFLMIYPFFFWFCWGMLACVQFCTCVVYAHQCAKLRETRGSLELDCAEWHQLHYICWPHPVSFGDDLESLDIGYRLGPKSSIWNGKMCGHV